MIASPPLVSGAFDGVHWWSGTDCNDEFEDCLPALRQLDQDPTALLQHLSALTSKRLGLRFEALVAFWLALSPNFAILRHNNQLIIDGITRGEVDFILKDLRNDKIIHLEVAVKFYLGTEPFDNSFRWFGTTLKDQLGKKVKHLRQRQTQLSKKYPEHFPLAVDIRQCFMKGRLFYPNGQTLSPDTVARNHLKGAWCRRSTKHDTQKNLIPIDKDDWLARLSKEQISTRQHYADFLTLDTPQCYISVSDEGEELERVFALPDGFEFPA